MKFKLNQYSYFFIAISFLFKTGLFAQGGEAAVPFLLTLPSPQITGMGETGTGAANNISAIYLNPGGLAFQKKACIELDYSKWLPASYLVMGKENPYCLNLSGSKHFENWGTFSAAFLFINLGQRIDEYIDWNGKKIKEEWNPYQYCFLIGYSKDFGEKLGIGINLKYLRSDLSSYDEPDLLAESWAFDLGILYKLEKFILPIINTDLSNKFSFGLNLTNLGPAISYRESSGEDPLPTNLRFGIGIKVINNDINNLLCAIDFSRILVRRHLAAYREPDKFYKAIFTAWEDGGLKKVVCSFGMEYKYNNPDFRILDNQIALAIRTGYLWEDEIYGYRKYYTFGAGLSYSIVSIDFSFLKFANQYYSQNRTFKWGMNIIL
jgi:hypothetical protein